MNRHWFEDIAEFLGPAYLRYSFTKGTEQEADFPVDALGLSAEDPRGVTVTGGLPFFGGPAATT